MWLLEASIWEALNAAQQANVAPTADQQAQFEATHIAALSDGGSRILTMAGDSAEISIKGVLTKAPSFLAMLFGGGNTTYADINSALIEAETNDNVRDITLVVDSPGGSVDGLFDTLNAIHVAKKPVKAKIINIAASAAYAIVSQADEIIATNQAVRVGSIGILASFFVSKNEVKITSTNAPNKAPDVSTPEGQAVIREELDAVHDLFVDAISRGREVSVEGINAKFGQGGILLAGEALKRGMIDSIAITSLQSVRTTTQTQTADSGGDNLKVKSMDLAKLKAEHPEAYAAAVKVGHGDGITAGVTQERDRVTAHLTMGESSGDMVTAIAACKDGDEMTATMQAKYMSAGMNRTDTAARDDDENDASAAGDNANDENDTTETDAEAVAGGIEAHFGTDMGDK